jgi:hypothetical protein
MKFSAFSERVFSSAPDIQRASSLSVADLAASLELSAVEFSPERVQFRLSELGEELKSEVTRPHAEQLLGETAQLFDVEPVGLFLESLQRSVGGAFMQELRELVPSHRVKQDGARYVVIVPDPVSAETERRVIAAAGRCDVAFEQALSEGLHLSFVAGRDVLRFIDTFEQAAATNYRPEIRFPNGNHPEFQFKDRPITTIVTKFASSYRAMHKEVERAVLSLGDSVTAHVLQEVVRKPGLLFFDYLRTRSPEIARLTSSHPTVRSFLREELAENPGLKDALSFFIEVSGRLLDHLIANDPERREFRGQMRPDSLLTSLVNSVNSGIAQVIGVHPSTLEVERMRDLISDGIDRDPWFGSELSGAFSIDFPTAAAEPYSRVAVKLFSLFDRRASAQETTSLQVILPVKPPDLEGDPAIDYERVCTLSRELERVLDDADLLDRFSGTERIQEVGQRALGLLGSSFHSFELLTHHGTRQISPLFEHLGHRRAIMQCITLWQGCSWLDKNIPEKNSERIFERIDNWIWDYTAQKGLYSPLSISDLAGVSGMFGSFAAHENPDGNEPSLDAVHRLLRARGPLIHVMPSGLHALLWILPARAQETLAALLDSNLIVLDRVTVESVQFLKSVSPGAAKPTIQALVRAMGIEGPIKLSSFISARA